MIPLVVALAIFLVILGWIGGETMTKRGHEAHELQRIEKVLCEVAESMFRIERKVNVLLRMEAQEMATIDDILTEVGELPTINDSLDALFAQLETLIGSGNPVKIQQAVDLLTAQKARTKASIVAHTPQADEIPPA